MARSVSLTGTVTSSILKSIVGPFGRCGGGVPPTRTTYETLRTRSVRNGRDPVRTRGMSVVVGVESEREAEVLEAGPAEGGHRLHLPVDELHDVEFERPELRLAP